MATWPPETWVDEEEVTVAVLTTRIENAFDDLTAHTHDGTAGDGSADIVPDSVTFTDAAAPAAPGAGKTAIYATAGKLHQRAGAGGADEQFDIVGHTHTLQEIAQNLTNFGTVSGETVGALTAQNADAINITSTYGATGRRRQNYTPSNAKAAVVCVGHVAHRNGRNGASSITFSDRIVIGGTQEKEVTQAVSDGDGTGAGAFNNTLGIVHTEIDGAASAVDYDYEHKESANDSGAVISDTSNSLAVVEVSV